VTACFPPIARIGAGKAGFDQLTETIRAAETPNAETVSGNPSISRPEIPAREAFSVP